MNSILVLISLSDSGNHTIISTPDLHKREMNLFYHNLNKHF